MKTSPNPTSSDHSSRIAALSPAKRALLERGLSRRAAGFTPGISPRADLTSAPLSYAQQRLWFLHRFQGGSVEYHMAQTWRLRGGLDAQALERAFNTIIERHESFRTHFVEVAGAAHQVISPLLKLPLPLVDLSALEAGDREEALARALHLEQKQPFDLSQGPLLRIRLFQLAPQEHLLAWTCHHIISDGWSTGVFNRELSALYQTFLERGESRLDPLPIQYADYALRQRRTMEGETGQRLLDYWVQKLTGAPPLLDIPTDHPRTAHGNHRGESRTLQLPPKLTTALTELCRREGGTLFMGLLAAFKLLLVRLSGQEDIVVGTPMAGRNDVTVENLIGFFINTLALRTDFSGNPGFTEALRRVRTTTLEAFEHQDLPFEKLVEKLQPERNLSHTPLFQVFFNLLNLQKTPLALAGLEVEPLEAPDVNAKFDLTLYAMAQGDGILFQAVYNSSIFRSETIERMLQQLQRLLEQIVENPQQLILNYGLHTQQTMRLLPDPTASLFGPAGIPVYQQFLNTARVSPAQPAVHCDGHGWTYLQLKDAAERIAKQLVAEGVQPGDVVVVSGRRSLGLIAGILGALGARGVILPMDAALPSARRDVMLQEACGRHWVRVDEGRYQEEDWGVAFRSLPTCLISPDGVCLAAPSEGAGNDVILSEPAASEPAYVFFTSGTTGKPKAILGSQNGLSHFIDWERQLLGVSHTDRVAQLTGWSFDVMLRDIFLALTSGAMLCLPGEDLVKLGDRLVAWLQQEGVTILHAVPSLAQAWLGNLPTQPRVPTLRWVLFAGEPLTDRLIAHWRNQIGNAAGIINLYGPTETTLAKCFHVVPDSPSAGIQPIGQPLPFTQILLLNQGNQLCGIGEPGEISIRTPYRSLGYLNASDTDRARFVANPFRIDPSDLIYRTGDIGWYAHDGTLMIRGRCDDQLKIRGARVEPGEISTVLADHGEILQSLVMPSEDAREERCLVAYIVPVKHHSGLHAKDLRAHLKKKLPDYMIPARFVVIPSLPLTANGKVDRKALAKLGGMELANGTDYLPPRNEPERALVEIWQALLGKGPIGVHDNFFDLGGHSLLAIQFISLLRTRTGVDLPIRMLFESPTPAALAGRLATEIPTASSAEPPAPGRPLIPIAEILGKQTDYVKMWKGKRSSPDSFIVTLNDSGCRPGLFWCLQGYRELTQLADHLGTDQPVHGMRSGYLIMEYTDENIAAIASRYAGEMMTLQPEGPFLLGGNCQGGVIARVIARQLRALGRTVSLLILMEQRAFPLYEGPIALIFGKESAFNPYQPGADPEAGFRQSYPAGFTVDIIAGAHGQFFEPPNIDTLAATLKRRLTDRSSGAATDDPLHGSPLFKSPGQP